MISFTKQQLCIVYMKREHGSFTYRYRTKAAQVQLHISNYLNGTAGYSLSPHNNMKFTTKDQDNDMWNDMNCATRYSERGGWWHNGRYDAVISMILYGGNYNN